VLVKKIVPRDEILGGDLGEANVQVLVGGAIRSRLYDRARITNGVAAGGPWVEVTFDTGELAGKRIWVTDLATDVATFIYVASANDDGFLFNFGEGVEGAEGGELIEDFDGATVRFYREV
jgi:hypothetical protein